MEASPYRFQLGDISTTYQVDSYQCYLEGICLAHAAQSGYATLDRCDDIPHWTITIVHRALREFRGYAIFYE